MPADVRHPQSLGRYLMVMLMLALALMSKPMVVTLPFVLLLLDYWPLKRFPQPDGRLIPWKLIIEKLPLLALSVMVCVVTLFAQRQAIASLPLSVRVGNALVSYVVLLKTDDLSSWIGRLLPASGRPTANLGNYHGCHRVAWHLRRRCCRPATAAVVFDGLVVVSRYANSSNRIDPVRDAGASRPVHLPPANWSVYSPDLGGG